MKLDQHKPTEADKVDIPGAYNTYYAKEVLGKVTPHKGQFCFEINLITGTIEVAKFEKSTFIMGKITNDKKVKEFKVDDEILVKPDCIYIVALNKKNALKKFVKISEPLFAPENK